MQFIGHSLYRMGWLFFKRVLAGSRRVRVAITVGDEVLLVTNFIGRQRWTLPGGGVKKREAVLSAACRELKEEIGLDITSTDLQPLESFPYTPEPNITWHAELIHLPLKSRPLLKKRFEILKLGWFKIDQLPDPRDELVDRALGRVAE